MSAPYDVGRGEFFFGDLVWAGAGWYTAGMFELLFWGADYSFWVYLLTVLILTHITIAAVTIFLHRHQAHRALDLHPAVSHFFRLWLWMTTGMVTREWVAVHRKHHAKAETEDDPHSPQIHGLASILWGGVVHYVRAKNDPEMLAKYSYGVPDDWLERNLYAKYPKLGVTLMAFINVGVFGLLPGMLMWGVQMVWIPFWAAGVVNGVGHYWGYRNFHPEDESRNIVPFGIIIGGEELHNNHHSFPTSARLSNRPFEFDLGWLYIRVLEMLRLAKVKRVAPRLLSADSRAACDLDTLQSVIANRLEVIVRFTRSVKPVCYQELSRFRGGGGGATAPSVGSVNNWLQNMEFRIDRVDREALARFIKNSPMMAKVAAMRATLISLWEDHTVAPEVLVERLHRWCVEAEQSGIAKLEKLAVELRGCRTVYS